MGPWKNGRQLYNPHPYPSFGLPRSPSIFEGKEGKWSRKISDVSRVDQLASKAEKARPLNSATYCPSFGESPDPSCLFLKYFFFSVFWLIHNLLTAAKGGSTLPQKKKRLLSFLNSGPTSGIMARYYRTNSARMKNDNDAPGITDGKRFLPLLFLIFFIAQRMYIV